MIYLDNAATTFTKPVEVYERSDEVLRRFSANPGRSGHQASLNAARIVLEARSSISEYFGCCNMESVIFTLNCTDALNIAINGLLNKSDHVITTVYEHNSVLRPLYNLQKTKNIGVSIAMPDENGKITPSIIEKLLKKSTKLVILNYVSNVTGAVQDVAAIGRFCKSHNIQLIVDAAQAAGTQPTKINELNADIICCAGHKGLYGPQGIGLLILNNDTIPVPLRFGGTGSHSSELDQPAEMPDYLESGTLATHTIAALEAGVNVISKQQNRIVANELNLAVALCNGLRSISGVTVYSPLVPKSGVVSFNLTGLDSSFTADTLDKKYGIEVRGGLHCAPLIHRLIGTESRGAVRASVGMFNTISDIDALLNAVNDIALS